MCIEFMLKDVNVFVRSHSKNLHFSRISTSSRASRQAWYRFHLLWLTQLFGWVTNCSVILFWTTFTAIDVYGGDPTAYFGSKKHNLFENGLRFGTVGLLLEVTIFVKYCLLQIMLNSP